MPRWPNTCAAPRTTLRQTPLTRRATERAIGLSKSDLGEQPIEINLDRHGSFEPQIAPKHTTPWAGFDEKFLLLFGNWTGHRNWRSSKQSE